MPPVILATLASTLTGADSTTPSPIAPPAPVQQPAPLPQQAPGASHLTMAAPAPVAQQAIETGSSAFDVVFPLTMLLLIAAVIPTALLSLNYILSRWALGTRISNPARNEPYESGLPSTVGNVGERFDVKFYLIAMLFLAFDIEVAFLYPWAVQFKHGGWEMVVMLVVFLILLEVGYLYLFKKGALDWDR
jgi:NADH-quinone oxidoreductase subunit A